MSKKTAGYSDELKGTKYEQSVEERFAQEKPYTDLDNIDISSLGVSVEKKIKTLRDNFAKDSSIYTMLNNNMRGFEQFLKEHDPNDNPDAKEMYETTLPELVGKEGRDLVFKYYKSRITKIVTLIETVCDSQDKDANKAAYISQLVTAAQGIEPNIAANQPDTKYTSALKALASEEHKVHPFQDFADRVITKTNRTVSTNDDMHTKLDKLVLMIKTEIRHESQLFDDLASEFTPKDYLGEVKTVASTSTFESQVAGFNQRAKQVITNIENASHEDRNFLINPEAISRKFADRSFTGRILNKEEKVKGYYDTRKETVQITKGNGQIDTAQVEIALRTSYVVATKAEINGIYIAPGESVSDKSLLELGAKIVANARLNSFSRVLGEYDRLTSDEVVKTKEYVVVPVIGNKGELRGELFVPPSEYDKWLKQVEKSKKSFVNAGFNETNTRKETIDNALKLNEPTQTTWLENSTKGKFLEETINNIPDDILDRKIVQGITIRKEITSRINQITRELSSVYGHYFGYELLARQILEKEGVFPTDENYKYELSKLVQQIALEYSYKNAAFAEVTDEIKEYLEREKLLKQDLSLTNEEREKALNLIRSEKDMFLINVDYEYEIRFLAYRLIGQKNPENRSVITDLETARRIAGEYITPLMRTVSLAGEGMYKAQYKELKSKLIQLLPDETVEDFVDMGSLVKKLQNVVLPETIEKSNNTAQKIDAALLANLLKRLKDNGQDINEWGIIRFQTWEEVKDFLDEINNLDSDAIDLPEPDLQMVKNLFKLHTQISEKQSDMKLLTHELTDAGRVSSKESKEINTQFDNIEKKIGRNLTEEERFRIIRAFKEPEFFKVIARIINVASTTDDIESIGNEVAISFATKQFSEAEEMAKSYIKTVTKVLNQEK